MTQPTLFVPHGAGPCFFMDWNPPDAWTPMAAYLRSIRNSLPAPPKAILVVSAHWLAPAFRLTSSPRPSLIFDYYGFPEHTYHLRYDAPGDPALARQIGERLQTAGLAAELDDHRGWDHGTFIPLLLMYPEATIPVIQLSLRQDLDPAAHLAAGRALAGLREQGVLLLGSGMSFHNMRGYGDPRFSPISETFDTWLGDTVALPETRRNAALTDWTRAPEALRCHPPGQEEHLLPLMVVAGAAGDSRGARSFSDQVLETQLSAFRFD